MKVLYITTASRPGGWLTEALAADSASQLVIEEAVGQAAGLARLRDEVFDAVLVSHEPGELDALDLIEGSRAGGAEEPIVVLGHASEQEMAVLCYEVGAEGYVSIPTTTTRNLIWVVARAVQRHRLTRENERFRQAHQTRLEARAGRGRPAVGRRVGPGRVPRAARSARCRAVHFRRPSSVVRRSFSPLSPPDAGGVRRPDQGAGVRASGSGNPAGPEGPFRPELVAQYRELLRAYVIMGNGNLSAELRGLAELLAAAGLTAPQAAELHLSAVEQLVHGLAPAAAGT